MADHHIPVNVSLTNVRRLTAPQHIGDQTLNPSGDRDWSTDEGMNLSCAALERMIAAGWQGYGRKRKRRALAAKSFADINMAVEWTNLPATVRDAVRNIVYREIAEARPR